LPDVGVGSHAQHRLHVALLLHHRHQPDDCGIVFASFSGNQSPLRPLDALASCRSGGQEIWWPVDEATEAGALQVLPSHIARRATATQVSGVEIP